MVRRRVPILKIMPMDAMFAKLGVAKPQLFFSQVTHLLAPNRSLAFRIESRMLSQSTHCEAAVRF